MIPPRLGEAWARVAGSMPYYRLYFLDRFSGHIDHFREFEAADDEAAIALGEQWREGCPMELWTGRRKVRHWDHDVSSTVAQPPTAQP